MADNHEIEEKFWSELKDSPFLMLRGNGGDQQEQPMTANFEDQDRESGRVWIFTSRDNDLVQSTGSSGPASAAYASKGHDVFAYISGELRIEDDRGTIDRLWSPMVAEWYERKDDPKLVLLCFEMERAKIWLSDMGGFLKPAFNKLFGRKPEAGMQEKVAEVSL